MNRSIATTAALLWLGQQPWQFVAKVSVACAFAAFVFVPDPLVRIGSLVMCLIILGLNK